ncbi:uncharacterized protein LOC128386854 [Panonychus citri]|uniref:uncharacterized protein LOC128386854 n=1 Tax=Panonychus citri TaxID=50023 RepID=UPI002308208D|nr:uncharacterized protein LOC128386854 [Panonychus citri]
MTLTILIVNTAIMLITAYPVIIIVYNNPTNFPGNPMVAFIWLVVDCCVNQLALGIIMFSLLYFDLICLVIGNKFRSIEEIIDEAALQCIKRRKEPNIFTSLTSLFNNYLDINDIVTDSDHFWGKISFYIISSHTTLFLFVTYSFIYGETHPILKYLFIIIGSHSLFVLYKICQSCYDVSYASAKRGYDNLSKINEFEAPKVVMMKILAFRRYMDSETIGYSGIYTKVTYETLFSWMFLVASLFLIIMDFANGTLPTGLSMKNVEF